MNKIIIAIIMVGVALATSLLFTYEETIPLKPLSIAVSRTPLSAPVYIAEEKGYFEDAGILVTLDEVVGGYRSFQAVKKGQSNLGTSSCSVMMFTGMGGDDYVILSSFVQSDNDLKLVSRSDAEIIRMEDLANKKIGVVKTTASEYFLSILLGIANIDRQSVQLIELKPEEMPDALAEGRVDAISVWEPYGFYSVQKMGKNARVLETKNLHTLSFNLATTRDYADQHQAELELVLKALYRATEFIAESPEEARTIIRNRLNKQQDFIDWIWPDYLFKLALNHSLVLSLENQARWAIDNQLTDKQTIPMFHNNIDKRALTAVLPEAVSL
ncbi:MAG: ABC transporter substrate-binding protein [Gammaproteobacteria bacterium]|nr:ABC transporter substrate-binding protein [Gammaproteobacteria bacterium]